MRETLDLRNVTRSHIPDRDMTALAAALTNKLGDRFATSLAVREAHGHGEGVREMMAPDGVAFAQETAEVAEIVRLCAQHRVPVIPFGVGTSLEGQIQASQGGISLDMSGMNRILSTSAADLDCRVEAGVTRQQLECGISAIRRAFLSARSRRERHAWAAWRRRAHRAPMPCATARCDVTLVTLTVVMAAGRRDPHRWPRAQILRRIRSDPALSSAAKARSASSPS
jgi:hypothetical protein